MIHEPEAVSSRSLLGAFFAVVVLCAVFFSLGFFLGYRQGHPANAPVTEQIPAASDVPAEVNPAESSPAGVRSEPPAGGGSSAASQPADPMAGSAPSSSRAPAASSEEETKPSPATEEDSPSGSGLASRVPAGVLVQVAALTNRQDAANVVNVLKSKSYPALILTPAQARAKDNFYRVVAGPYRSRTEAENARKELSAEGFKPFIR